MDNPIRLISDYFNYLARQFPVMCASDEFHFLPRVEAASRYYHLLESLSEAAVRAHIDAIKGYRNGFLCALDHAGELEQRIDFEMLAGSAAGLLIELEENRSWQHNPLLYLKIAFIGLDHALHKPAGDEAAVFERTVSRLRAIPELLLQCRENIRSVPDTHYTAAHAMVSDARDYLDQIFHAFPPGPGVAFHTALERVKGSLNAFQHWLSRLSPVPDDRIRTPTLAATLRDHFLCERSLDEIYRLAEDQWTETWAALSELRARIDPNRSWQDLYHAYIPAPVEKLDTVSLYTQEIDALNGLFSKYGVWDEAPLEVAETPVYLRSVRGSASFAAALTADSGEPSYFYLTTRLPREHGNTADELLKKRLHREYRFLCAHETIPGHHLLDSFRRRLENPVRRQVESPLFYEGWATYAESLPGAEGYPMTPLDRVVQCKRRLWRAARCKIDVGLHSGRLDREGARRLLVETGFSAEEADRQIHRFQLSPGYQLCYSLGHHEFLRLKAAYAHIMGEEKFHTFILEGGQMPFRFIEKRIQELKDSRDR